MIKFESEHAFEMAFFDYIIEKNQNPLTGLPVKYAARQVSFGDHGIADIVIVDVIANSFYLHVIELKITPISFPDIGQLCRYKNFIDESGLVELIGAADVYYSLITHPSTATPNMICTAKAAGIDLLFYQLDFNGVIFESQDDFNSDAEKTSLAADQLSSKININLSES